MPPLKQRKQIATAYNNARQKFALSVKVVATIRTGGMVA
jgi:hypothetical protein